jgi:hypothetical protein
MRLLDAFLFVVLWLWLCSDCYHVASAAVAVLVWQHNDVLCLCCQAITTLPVTPSSSNARALSLSFTRARALSLVTWAVVRR